METTTAFRHSVAAVALTAGWACAKGPPQDRGYDVPPQDSLAAVIRTVRAGEDEARLAEAVAAAARIPPEQVGDELQDAMERALALTIASEDSVLGGLGAVLEEALGAIWSQADLAAAMREIAAEMGGGATRHRIAARLALRIEAGQAGQELLAAMAGAVASVSWGQYDMHSARDEMAAAWVKHHSADELAGFIRSIAGGAERPEQAAAVHVVFYGRLDRYRPYFRHPPPGVDSTGVTDPELRAALVEALAYRNDIAKRRARERNRLEAIGDQAGLDSLRRAQYGRPFGIHYLHDNLAWAVSAMRDPATIGLLAAAPVDVSLEPFGEAAVSPILAVLADATADRDHAVRLLTQLTWIVKRHELTTGSRGAVTEAVQGFLDGETLRAMQITDPRGNVLSSAVDLAVALDDSVSLAMIRGIASDPAEAVRAGVAPGNANRLVSEVRRKIGWTPPARSQAEITAELRTVTRSAGETLAQIEAATLAARIDPGLLSDTLRAVMIEAWDHASRAADGDDWYRVESALEDGLRAGFTPSTALAAIRAIPAGRYGAEQVLAVEFVGRLREDAGEDLRLAAIAALEHLNGVPVDEQPFPTSPVVSLQHRLVYTVGGLEDPRSIPALARSGWGFTCKTHMVQVGSREVARETLVAVAREILAAIAEPGAPPRRVSAGLSDLAVMLMGNDLTRDIPDDLVDEIVAAARGYLDGTSMGGFATAGSHPRRWVVRSAILLAAVADEPGLVALAEGLAADPEAVAALGFTDPESVETIRDEARSTLARRPILALTDC